MNIEIFLYMLPIRKLPWNSRKTQQETWHSSSTLSDFENILKALTLKIISFSQEESNGEANLFHSVNPQFGACGA
uniref:Alternative protein RIMKLB n=1 Tax=Homo sapiens TaxID=9606 RepID=L8EB22_HUMAN|nr:alternative protein RIMKLB [Homo sapiens]